jgi:osmotically-inducible protein OsmY
MRTQTQSPSIEEVERRIHAALAVSADDGGHDIRVNVKENCVVLRGAVRSWAEHEGAEEAARTTPGVTRIDNQLALLVEAKPSKY